MRRARAERPLAFAAAVATFGGYMVGSGRAFGYDAAVTMANFVEGPPSWALTRQIVYNNHPLFSLVEGGVADVVGTSEVSMRVLPALCAAISVGLLVWRLGARWGWLPGLSAGAVLAVHPILVPLARDPRGYSLAVLAIVVMGIAAFDVDRPGFFAVAGVIGVGTQLYVLIVVAAVGVWLFADGNLVRRWRLALLVAGVGGLSVYLGMLASMGRGGRIFRPDYPFEAGRAFLGGSLITQLALGSLVLIAVLSIESDRRLVAVMGVLAAGFLVPWLIAPQDLYPRFIYWAVPALAAAIGIAVRAVPRSAVLVAVAVLGCIVPQVHRWSRDELPNRALGQHVPADTCAVTWTYEALRWYADLAQGDGCATVALLLPEATEPETTIARATWPVVCWAIEGAEVRGHTARDCRQP